MSKLCIDHPLKFPLSIHPATLSYCIGTDPHLQWAARGATGYDGDPEAKRRLAVEEERAEGLAAKLSAGSETNGTGRLVGRALEIFNDAIQGTNVAAKFFPGKRFLLVIGPPRSGGTAVLSRLFKTHTLNMRDFNLPMVHDSIPGYHLLNNTQGNANLFACAVFEFCQFLAWAEQAFADSPVVIQKRIAHAFWLQPLENLLGDAATYIATLRHPLACAISFYELSKGARDYGEWVRAAQPGRFRNPNSVNWLIQIQRSRALRQSDWEGLGYLDQFRLQWEALMTDLGRFGGIGDRLVPVVYGQPYPTLFSELVAGDHGWARGRNRDYRKLAGDFGIDQDAFERSIRRVRRTWEAAGFTFPNLPLA